MNRLRLLRGNERGSVPIEGVMGALLLLGWYVVAFQFYDAFRSKGLATRASYTVGDLISREKTPIGPKYLAGTKKLFDYIQGNRSPSRSWMRMSIIYCRDVSQNNDPCDGTNKKFSLETSQNTGGVANHTAESINKEFARIPKMAEGDYAVVLETSVFYNPLFDIGDKGFSFDGGSTWTRIGLSSSLRFSNFVVTRPRGPPNVWNNSY